MARLRMEVEGTVQGVGFRPAVYRLALEQHLTGRVWNHAQGVTIEVQGAAAEIERFLDGLRDGIPVPAHVTRIRTLDLPDLPGEEGFRILPSQGGDSVRPMVPPDLAVCGACSEELATPGARRHRYPFTNCTRCGPRYSIIAGLPYDRPATTMRSFPMCAACAEEYQDPLDRRFHAQPIACPSCGPRLALRTMTGTLLAEGEAALAGAVVAVRDGQVLAMKGLGGYQLIVDAASEAAIHRLRIRKGREAKPFAVMFPDEPTLRGACEVSDSEWALLAGPEAPILLLVRRPDSPVHEGVAPGNPRIGAFLPSTPLHRLLLGDMGVPVVCTSGNLSDEPMAYRDEEALDRLGGIADCFLTHDRPILRPVDDSILRIDGDGPTLLRRARGFAPLPLPLPELAGAPVVLAVGAHQKSTVSLLRDGELVMSQHLGDLTSQEGADLIARTVEDLLGFFRVRPDRLACDLHPDYASTRLAERLATQWGLPLVRVQHHHAHGAACAAEHQLEGPVTALVWDGSGLGTDGTLWGGEAMVIDRHAFRRVGHLRPFPLPGGDSAAREPRRSAAGLIWSQRGRGAPPGVLCQAFGAEWELLQSMLEQRLNSPFTSSIGRLFDAISALVGLVPARRGFEGQAAMALEFAAGDQPELPYSWEMAEGVADPAPLVDGLLRDQLAGKGPAYLAARFHATLAVLAVTWARQVGLPDVVLSGGCFQNALLAARVREALLAAGFRVHRHQKVPPNDGGISLGQAVVAGWSGA